MQNLFACLVCFTAFGVTEASGQANSNDGGEQQATAAQRWLHDYYQKQAAAYEFYLDEAKSKRLTFVEKSIFHWKQDDDWSGDLFVWTHQGRPQIVGCILGSAIDGDARSIAHEFHTLAFQSLPRAKVVNGTWEPKAGLSPAVLEGADAPAMTSALRLAQLRKLAREFSVEMMHEGKPWELRLLPQPIYRYSAPDAGVIDGGLFAYVWTRGTDPELLLLLECRDEKPDIRWHYAPVRFTTRELSVRRRDREIWHAAAGGGWIQGPSQESYVTFYAGRVSVPADAP